MEPCFVNCKSSHRYSSLIVGCPSHGSKVKGSIIEFPWWILVWLAVYALLFTSWRACDKSRGRYGHPLGQILHWQLVICVRQIPSGTGVTLVPNTALMMNKYIFFRGEDLCYFISGSLRLVHHFSSELHLNSHWIYEYVYFILSCFQ